MFENSLLAHYDLMQPAVHSVSTLNRMRDQLSQLSKIKPNDVNCTMESQREKITNLLNKYRSICEKENEKVESARVEPMGINTGDAAPVHRRQYTTPFALKESLKEQIKIMKEAGVICESRSPWNSRIFLIKEKNQESARSLIFAN